MRLIVSTFIIKPTVKETFFDSSTVFSVFISRRRRKSTGRIWRRSLRSRRRAAVKAWGSSRAVLLSAGILPGIVRIISRRMWGRLRVVTISRMIAPYGIHRRGRLLGILWLRILLSALRIDRGEVGIHLLVFFVFIPHKIVAEVRIPEFYAVIIAHDFHLLFQQGVFQQDLGNLYPSLFIELDFAGVPVTPDGIFPEVFLIGVEHRPIAANLLVPEVAGIEMETAFRALGNDKCVISLFGQQFSKPSGDIDAILRIQRINIIPNKQYLSLLISHNMVSMLSDVPHLPDFTHHKPL